MTVNDLYGGLIRLHVLHHAAEGPIFGLDIIEELRHHGYQISAGTPTPCCTDCRKRDTCLPIQSDRVGAYDGSIKSR